MLSLKVSNEIASITRAAKLILAGLFSLPVMAAPEAAVTIHNREYAQVDQFRNLTWYQLNAACPMGACIDRAILNGIDVTGWKWASNFQANELFNYYVGADLLGDANTSHAESASSWGPLFFKDFRPTNVIRGNVAGRDAIIGDWLTVKTSDPLNDLCSHWFVVGCVTQVIDFYDSEYGSDRIETKLKQTAGYSETGTGALLFREVKNNVPEPATLMLALVGLGALGAFRGRNRIVSRPTLEGARSELLT